MKIAILGTFDLENYGDLLFPLLAQHELSKRLGEVEVLPFSYRPKHRPDWPYNVFPIEEFPSHIDELDAVLVGGGHLIRFDQEIAEGYGPGPGIHHPTGLWLVPPFLSAAAGLSVIWNGVGASPDLEEWAIDLFRCCLEASAYVSARDEASRATLRAVADQVDVTIVPDSAFGVAELLIPPPVREGFQNWCEQHELREPYVVVQANPRMAPIRDDLHRELEEVMRQGVTVVELPIGPVLGDQQGLILPQSDEVVRSSWPDPLLLAKIISSSEAVIGQSLHLSITAVCHGVPVHRPRCWPGSKYEILGGFPSVHQYDENGREPQLCLQEKLGRREVAMQVRDYRERLDRHWDRIVEVASTPVFKPAPVAKFFYALPFRLIDAEVSKLEREAIERNLRATIQEERDPQSMAEERHDLISSGLSPTAAQMDRLRTSVRELRNLLSREKELKTLPPATQRDREQRIDALCADVMDLASRDETDAWPLAEQLMGTLDDIYRSKAWRASILLRRLYLLLTRPFRFLRSLVQRGR